MGVLKQAVTRKTDLLHIVIQDRLNVQVERRQKLLQAKIQLKKRPYNKLRKTTAKEMRDTSRATRNFIKAAGIIEELKSLLN